MTQSALAFHGTTFDIIDRNGQPWLRAHQIGVALDYKRSDIIAKLYRANAAEFTDSMTAVVKLPTAGGVQDVRIFSLRGAHLLAMFARTARAAEFRRWVLDVLDAQTQPTTITPAQQQHLKELVDLVVESGKQTKTNRQQGGFLLTARMGVLVLALGLAAQSTSRSSRSFHVSLRLFHCHAPFFGGTAWEGVSPAGFRSAMCPVC